MKAWSAAALIVATACTKKKSSRYFRPRSGTSSHFQGRKLRPKSLRPSRARVSERRPTGQIQEQNDLRATKATATMITNSMVAAGWMRLSVP